MREVTFLACPVLPTEHGTSDQEIAAFSASVCCALFSNMQPPRKTANHRSAEKPDKLLKTIGGSVCESNAPLTSKMPIASFEDRESHRTPFASAGRHYCCRHCKQLGANVSRNSPRWWRPIRTGILINCP